MFLNDLINRSFQTAENGDPGEGLANKMDFFLAWSQMSLPALASSNKLGQMGSDCFLGLYFINMHIH